MMQFGIFLHSLVVGFMIFFMAVVSPTIFKALDEANSGAFLRQLFPRMFLYGLITMLLAFLTTLNSQLNIYWIISAISSILFAINLYIITPKINYHRDEAKLGNSLSEKKSSSALRTSIHESCETKGTTNLFGSAPLSDWILNVITTWVFYIYNIQPLSAIWKVDKSDN